MAQRHKIYKANGIVLKRKNVNEADRFVTLFTQQFGKIKTIAKGVRKISSRRSGHLEIFTLAEFTLYTGRSFDYITEVTCINQFESFRGDLRRASFAYYLCELVDYLVPENQEQPDVYDRLFSGLQRLNQMDTEEDRHREVYHFALDILWHLGFLPKTQVVPTGSIHSFIESITERRLKTIKLLET